MDIYSKDQYKAFDWCDKNNIKVYCLPRKPKEKLYAIQVDNNGNLTTSEKKYKKNQVSTKIWEIYCHMYLKYKK